MFWALLFVALVVWDKKYGAPHRAQQRADDVARMTAWEQKNTADFLTRRFPNMSKAELKRILPDLNQPYQPAIAMGKLYKDGTLKAAAAGDLAATVAVERAAFPESTTLKAGTHLYRLPIGARECAKLGAKYANHCFRILWVPPGHITSDQVRRASATYVIP